MGVYDLVYVCEGERVDDGHVCMCMGGDGAGLQGMKRCLKAQRAQRRVRHCARLWPRRARRSSSLTLEVRYIVDALATACVFVCVFVCPWSRLVGCLLRVSGERQVYF